MSDDAARPSPYIVSRAYDWAFFLLPPVLSLAAGIGVSGSDFSNRAFHLGGEETTSAALVLGVLIHAHVVAVLFRSHGNPGIFRRWPRRFVLVPVLLWLAISTFEWASAFCAVLATFWDVWHSGAQTFGLARIYERNSGSPPELGRDLDFWANQLLYAGPIMAGVTLADHLETLGDLGDLGATFFRDIPPNIVLHQRPLSWIVVCGGALFFCYYAWAQLRLRARGYRSSPLKVWLVASTGVCSIYSWGFNSWGEAFFIMNLFHAVQYLALAWCTERERIVQHVRRALKSVSNPRVSCFVFLLSVLAYGVVAQVVSTSLHGLWTLTLVLSLMHFWYDGFIWSVRDRDV